MSTIDPFTEPQRQHLLEMYVTLDLLAERLEGEDAAAVGRTRDAVEALAIEEVLDEADALVVELEQVVREVET